MAWSQHTVRVKAPKAGCHLITDDIVQAVPEIQQLKVGLANLFLQHTSAALTLNENCDPDVRKDMKAALERLAPRGGGAVKYKHDCEGPDDMPAHITSSLMGASVTIPIQDGALALGTWQGLWLVEARDHPSTRRILVTLQGQPATNPATAAASAGGGPG